MPAISVKSLGRDIIPHTVDVDHCICSRDHEILSYSHATGYLDNCFSLPAASPTMAGRFRHMMARSWLRNIVTPSCGLENVAEVPDCGFVVLYDRIYSHRAESESSSAIIRSPIERPLYSPLRGGIAVHGNSGNLYYGEYINGRKIGVRIYRINIRSQSIEVCWDFRGDEIKHVHSIHFDRFRNRLWVCTGDMDHESSIYFTDNEFASLQRLGGGDQTWRAIAMVFDETGIEWGMDAGKDAPADAINSIYRYDFSSEKRTELAVIGNPAYAACEFADGTAVMATSFEPGRKQDTPEEVALWFRGPDRVWCKGFSLAYQHRPRSGQGPYGHLYLPKGISPAGELLCLPINTAKHHYQLLRLSVDWEAGATS